MKTAKEIFDTLFHHSSHEELILQAMEEYAAQYVNAIAMDEIKELKEENSRLDTDYNDKRNECNRLLSKVSDLESDLVKAKELMELSVRKLGFIENGDLQRQLIEFIESSPTVKPEQTEEPIESIVKRWRTEDSVTVDAIENTKPLYERSWNDKLKVGEVEQPNVLICEQCGKEVGGVSELWDHYNKCENRG